MFLDDMMIDVFFEEVLQVEFFFVACDGALLATLDAILLFYLVSNVAPDDS